MPRLALVAAVLTALAAALPACSCGDHDADRPTTPADATYEGITGVVEAMPREGADRREISIAHEAIPSFVDREGEEVGMDAMTMQFAVSSDVNLDGVETGDAVSFDFEVRWDDRPMLLVTRLEEE